MNNEQFSRPFDFLNKSMGKSVLVLMKGGVQIRGTLQAFDIHMNVVLEDATKLSNEDSGEIKYGKTMLRGDSVVLISL